MHGEVPQNPAPAYSCSSSSSGAIPAIRVRAMVSGFHQVSREPGMFGSICGFDNGPTLQEIGARIMDALR